MIDESSANGTYVDGVKVDRFQLTKDVQVALGQGGPVLSLHVEYPLEEEEEKEDPFTVTQYQKHYFDDKNGDEAG